MRRCAPPLPRVVKLVAEAPTNLPYGDRYGEADEKAWGEGMTQAPPRVQGVLRA